MRILILRFSSLGDILLATPVLTLLKEKYPDCTIEWVVKSKFSAALSTSLIDQVHTFSDSKSFKQLITQLKTVDYDLVFDLHRNFKSWQIRRHFKNVFCYEKREIRRMLLVLFKIKYPVKPVPRMYFKALELAGIKTPDSWDLLFDVSDIKSSELLQKNNLIPKKYLAIAPGASYFSKRWPQSYFAELAKLLSIEFHLVLLGSGSVDEEVCSQIAHSGNNITNLAGKLSFAESAAVIKNSRLLISNDSGLLHLAECFKTPVVAFFGSTTEELGFFPYSTRYKVLENKDLKCRPCSHFGRRKCPEQHFGCMLSLKPENAYYEINKFIKNN